MFQCYSTSTGDLISTFELASETNDVRVLNEKQVLVAYDSGFVMVRISVYN